MLSLWEEFMKKMTVLILALLLTACSSWPEYNGYAKEGAPPPPSHDSTRIYDKDGNFMGHIDESNRRVYDRNGRFIGTIGTQ